MCQNDFTTRVILRYSTICLSEKPKYRYVLSPTNPYHIRVPQGLPWAYMLLYKVFFTIASLCILAVISSSPPGPASPDSLPRIPSRRSVMVLRLYSNTSATCSIIKAHDPWCTTSGVLENEALCDGVEASACAFRSASCSKTIK